MFRDIFEETNRVDEKTDEWHIVIPGLNDKLDKEYQKAEGVSNKQAIRNLVKKIVDDVDAGKIGHKNWKFGSWIVTNNNIGGLVKYILDNEGTLVKTKVKI